MDRERKDFEELVQILNEISAKMSSMHGPASDFNTGVPLYRAEIHAIKAIGDNPGINMTRLAEYMGVTKGAVSQTIGKLVRKGLVLKKEADDNDKEILPQLTELGWKGYNEHERHHTLMFEAVRDHYGDRLKSELERFMGVIRDLRDIMYMFEEKGVG
jgi:DNA-binding MarR family transcriptional regulator